MAYRDPVAAALARVAEHRQVVDGLEERITPALLDQLPAQLSADLETSSANVEAMLARVDAERDLELMRSAVEVLTHHTALLEEAIARAPKLGRKFNRLPRVMPERATPTFAFQFPDVFSKAQLSLRETLHADIDALDPKARLFDRRAGYFDGTPSPYLVEAGFRVDYNPLRLQVCARQHDTFTTTGLNVVVESCYSLVTGVRPSTPPMKLSIEGLKSSLLSGLGLLRDAKIGDDELDPAFVIDADAEDARRVFDAAARRALSKLTKQAKIRVVTIENELARVEWEEEVSVRATADGDPRRPLVCAGLHPAVDLLVAIRATPPTPLLAQLERRRRGS